MNQLPPIVLEKKYNSLDIAVSKAIEEWLTKVHKVLISQKPPDDPVQAIWGMLSHVDKTGVELQHEAKQIRVNKATRDRNVPERTFF
ncbi:MAG: hypothetical protein OIN87_00330 [Candidatus Methanoperedens sp.]|nr:hypothetical protein [Candidatus Methanoperedens sp.]